MHRAKGDRFVRANELPVCDNAHTAASYQPMVELSIICEANSNFVADSK